MTLNNLRPFIVVLILTNISSEIEETQNIALEMHTTSAAGGAGAPPNWNLYQHLQLEMQIVCTALNQLQPQSLFLSATLRSGGNQLDLKWESPDMIFVKSFTQVYFL